MFTSLNRRISLGRWLGLAVSISPLSLLCFIGFGLLSVIASMLLVQLDLGSALWASLLVMVGLFISEWLHHWGHALAAKRTGYPMQGMFFFSLLAASQYPADEPPLPAGTHIRRALGGFWVNVLIGLLLGAAANSLWAMGSALGWATTVLAVSNFFVLGLGALFPINIPSLLVTDGATILHYWRQHEAHPTE